MSDLEHRLRKLERANRTLAFVVIVAICATVFVGFRVERMEKALKRQELIAAASGTSEPKSGIEILNHDRESPRSAGQPSSPARFH